MGQKALHQINDGSTSLLGMGDCTNGGGEIVTLLSKI
jgi:hypothetical protein